MSDFIWASPVCTPWSHACPLKIRQTSAMKKIGDLTRWTVDLIHKIKPQFWCIENPAGTALHKMNYMNTKRMKGKLTECSQCMYGRPFQKNTSIWNNFKIKLNTCTCVGPHKVKLGGNYGGTPGCRKWSKSVMKSMIPEKLVESIYNQLSSKLK